MLQSGVVILVLVTGNNELLIPGNNESLVTGVMHWLSVLIHLVGGAHPLGVFGARTWAHRFLHLVHPFLSSMGCP